MGNSVSNSKLEPRSALNGYSLEREGISITEIVDSNVYSLASNASQRSAVNASLQSAFAVDWPEVGRCSVSSDTTVRLLGLQSDQVFIVLDDANRFDAFNTAIADTAWCTEQADSWVSVKISGERRFDVLERTCPIDLAPTVFPDKGLARTSMEHIGAIIYRDGESFVLMAPRSMARSFKHMLDESVEYVL